LVAIKASNTEGSKFVKNGFLYQQKVIFKAASTDRTWEKLWLSTTFWRKVSIGVLSQF